MKRGNPTVNSVFAMKRGNPTVDSVFAMKRRDPTVPPARIDFSGRCVGKIRRRSGETDRDRFSSAITLVPITPFKICHVHSGICAIRCDVNPRVGGGNSAARTVNINIETIHPLDSQIRFDTLFSPVQTQ
jgi:hypothetical protein